MFRSLPIYHNYRELCYLGNLFQLFFDKTKIKYYRAQKKKQKKRQLLFF